MPCLSKRPIRLTAGRTVIDTLDCPDKKGIYILQSLYRNADECIIAAFHFDGSMCIWDIRERKHLRTIKLHDEIAHLCTVVGSKVVTSSPDGTFQVSNWQTGQMAWKKKLGEPEGRFHGKQVGNAVFAQAVWEGKIVAGTKDGRLWVFDLESG
jgi:outer membrane protein assembly factor BamB